MCLYYNWVVTNDRVGHQLNSHVFHLAMPRKQKKKAVQASAEPKAECCNLSGCLDEDPIAVEVTDEMETAAVPLEMTAGSLSIHDSYVVHGSNANTSQRRRAAYTMRYANAKTVTVDTTEHWVPVYLVCGEAGTRHSGYVDRR